jgi:hypothetical protein
VSIGVSGTRLGMNSAQWLEVQDILEQGFDINGGVLLHGDCVGVDAECHELGRRYGYWIKSFPPRNPKHRAFCDADEQALPDEYLARDRALVDESDTMLIVPEKAEEDSPRSGTWYTYRYSLEVGKPTTLIVGGRFEYTPEHADFVHVPTPEELARWQPRASGEPEVPGDGVHRQSPR